MGIGYCWSSWVTPSRSNHTSTSRDRRRKQADGTMSTERQVRPASWAALLASSSSSRHACATRCCSLRFTGPNKHCPGRPSLVVRGAGQREDSLGGGPGQEALVALQVQRLSERGPGGRSRSKRLASGFLALASGRTWEGPVPHFQKRWRC